MKKIMIALLAIAVLFGFAACDNSTGSGTTADDLIVTSLSVEKAAGAPAAYFNGEKLDKEDYVIVATQLNGEKVDVSDSATTTTTEYELSGADNDDAKEVEIAFTYTPVMGTAVTGKISVPVYNLTNFAVTGPQKQYYAGQDETDLNRADYVVTGYALDSKKNVLFERALDADEYTINKVAANAASGTAFTTGEKTLAVLPVYGSTPTALDANAKTDIKITVVPNTVESISVKLKDGVEAIIGTVAKAASEYVEVTFTMASGTTTTSGYTADVNWEEGFDTGSVFTDAERTLTATYGTGETAKTASVTIKPVADYIKSFTIGVETTAATKAKIGTTDTGLLMVNDDLAISDLTVTVADKDWASGKAPTTGAPDAAALKAALCMTDGINSGLKTFAIDNYEDQNELPVSFYIDHALVKADADCNITTVIVDADLTENAD